MNIVLYARYSSSGQREESIEGQLKVCYEYAKSNNYIVIDEYIDRATTATNDNRPQFQKMLADSDKKQFQGVLVYQLDRFARNRYDSAINKAKLKKNGVRVFSAKENLSDDPAGIMLEGMLETMAEYFSADMAQKIRRGHKVNAEKAVYNGGATSSWVQNRFGTSLSDRRGYCSDSSKGIQTICRWKKYCRNC